MNKPETWASRLPEGIVDLLQAAEAARANAYAPYSRFTVGAAIRSGSGRIYAAANVENAAYPVGTCAETGAISAMIAGGDREIAEILVSGVGRTPVTPCGACRQRIFEFGKAETPVYAAGPDGVKACSTIGDLLPQAFGPHALDQSSP